MSVKHRFSVSPRDVGKYEAALGRSFYKTIRDAIKGNAEVAVGHLIEATLLAKAASPSGERGAVNTGVVADSFKVKDDVVAGGSGPGVRNVGVIVTNSAPYFKYIEADRPKGAKPPPVAVLADWLVNRHGWDDHNAKWYARKLSKKIAENGLEAREIVKSARPGIVKSHQAGIIFMLRTWLSPRRKVP